MPLNIQKHILRLIIQLLNPDKLLNGYAYILIPIKFRKNKIWLVVRLICLLYSDDRIITHPLKNP